MTELAALFAVSAAALAFEILLLRLFEFSHWHHFAGFAIALALLGFGAAGTTLAVLGAHTPRLGEGWLLSCLVATAAGLLAVLAVQAEVALRPLFAAWDTAELGRLLLVDLLAFLPFYATGLAIGQAFARWPHSARTVYAANLLGSGVGAMGATGLLVVAQAESALAGVAAALLSIAAALGIWWRRFFLTAVGLVLAFVAAFLVLRPPVPAVSDFKALARLLDLPGVEILATEPGLHGRLTLVRAPSIRVAPGLSLAWPEPVPSTDALVIGSDRVVPIARSYSTAPDLGMASLAGLPLRLRPDGPVLVLGSGSWLTPWIGAGRTLDWVEPDHRILALAAERGAAADGNMIAQAPFRYLGVAGARYSVVTVDGAYDGADASAEDYLLTEEGLARALGRLEPGGLLALPLEASYPPRRYTRALATILAALKQQGVTEPGAHLAVLRGLQAMLLVVSTSPVPASDLAQIRSFAERWSFDLVWLAGLEASETNRFHRLEQPAFFEATRALLTQAPPPAVARWFATAPADLSRPYFWRSLDWRRLPELVDSLGPRAMSYLDWSLLLTAITTVLVTALGFVLILLPLGRLPTIQWPFDRLSVAGYFAALGLGYMLIELAIFQRAILLLGEPVRAASLVFAIFLIGSGLGSATAPVTGRPRTLAKIYGAVALGLTVSGLALWTLVDPLLAPPMLGRMAVLGLLLLPLTWAMGRPFPWALHQLGYQPRWLPWAWGINGFASVAAASVAPLISVHYGQPITLAAGAACYGVAVTIAWRWLRR